MKFSRVSERENNNGNLRRKNAQKALKSTLRKSFWLAVCWFCPKPCISTLLYFNEKRCLIIKMTLILLKADKCQMLIGFSKN